MNTAIVIALCTIIVVSIVYSAFMSWLEFKREMEREHHRLADRNLDLEEKKFELHKEALYDQMNARSGSRRTGPGLAKTTGGNGKVLNLTPPQREDHQSEVGDLTDDLPPDA